MIIADRTFTGAQAEGISDRRSVGALRPHYAEDQSVRKVYVRLVVSSRREANDVFDDRFSGRAEWF